MIAVIVALALQPAPAMLRSLFEEALAERASEYGEADKRTAQAARDLGLFLIRQVDLPAARDALARAIHCDEKALGPLAPQLLADLAELASISEPAQAEPMWLRTTSSPDAAIAARSFAALGELREQVGDRAGAAALYRQALAKEEIATGNNSLRTAARLNTLSLVVDRLEAISLLERALRISAARVGVRRLETASIQMNLAGHLLNTDRTRRAARLAGEAANTFAEILGPEHPRTAAGRSLFARAAGLRSP